MPDIKKCKARTASEGLLTLFSHVTERVEGQNLHLSLLYVCNAMRLISKMAATSIRSSLCLKGESEDLPSRSTRRSPRRWARFPWARSLRHANLTSASDQVDPNSRSDLRNSQPCGSDRKTFDGCSHLRCRPRHPGWTRGSEPRSWAERAKAADQGHDLLPVRIVSQLPTDPRASATKRRHLGHQAHDELGRNRLKVSRRLSCPVSMHR